MIDRGFIGTLFPEFSVKVEEFQLKLFSNSIGEERPEYINLETARASGHRGLLAPPTFLFSIWMQDPVKFRLANYLSLDLSRILHGEQKFEYEGQIYSGDIITIQEKIVNIYDKKSGQLEFIESSVLAKNNYGENVGKAKCTTVYRGF